MSLDLFKLCLFIDKRQLIKELNDLYPLINQQRHSEEQKGKPCRLNLQTTIFLEK